MLVPCSPILNKYSNLQCFISLPLVTCDADAEGVVRLMGGPSKLEGRVEMCMNGEFGTICDQNWGEKEARIVCGEISRKSMYVPALLE